MTTYPQVCIIGAGSSGIATAKAMQDAGIRYDCFEKGDRVGGLWVYRNSNGVSAAYRHLHINTSRRRMEYSDYPMPRWYPDFPHHSLIAEYFDDYAEHFGIKEHITFGTSVERCTRDEGGTWHVTLDDGRTMTYDALAVANGHHWDPRWPDPPFPGDFDGVQMHGHDYDDNGPFRGKNVVVVGMGNTAMDVAVEACHTADHVYLSARRGAHIVPKYVFGRPLDEIGFMGWLPWRVQSAAGSVIQAFTTGPMRRYGLPEPDHRVLQAHPTISADVLDRIGHGDIEPKPAIERLDGDGVVFSDGSRVRADFVVYCTGYRVTFPFFDPDFVSAPGNVLPLYKRVFHPEHPNLFFIALVQPLGAMMPIAERQSRWVAAYLKGDYHLPPARLVRLDMALDEWRLRRRYVTSERHTMQIDFDRYLRTIDREMLAGRARALLAGNRLPVPRRAQASPLREPAPV